MTRIEDLYSDLILEHGRHPRHATPLTEASHCARGHNPLCGDEVTVMLKIEDDRIVAVGCPARGCAISIASASLVGEAVAGRSPGAAAALATHLLTVLEGHHDDTDGLGPLAALTEARRFPLRMGCASLCVETLLRALAPTPADTSPSALGNGR